MRLCPIESYELGEVRSHKYRLRTKIQAKPSYCILTYFPKICDYRTDACYYILVLEWGSLVTREITADCLIAKLHRRRKREEREKKEERIREQSKGSMKYKI